MKYVCDGCERLADALRFRLEGAELVLTCSRCGAETRARSAEPAAEPVAAASPLSPAPAPGPAPAPAARVVSLHAVPPPTFGEDPFAVPEDRCPKCVAPRPAEALTCRQCGLVFANFVAGEYQLSPELRDAWLELTRRWDDQDAHDRVLAGATARGELAAAGRLYRIRLARQPKDPIAARGRDEVLRLAATTAPLSSIRSTSNPERTKRTLLMGAVLLMSAGLLFLSYWVLARG